MSPCLGHEEGRRSQIPHFGGAFQGGNGNTARHQRHLIACRAQNAQFPRPVQPVALQAARANQGESRFVGCVDAAGVDGFPIAGGALPSHREVHFVHHGEIRHRHGGLPTFQEGQQHAPHRQAEGEVGRAVQRVDDPGFRGLGEHRGALLAQHRHAGEGGFQGAGQALVGFQVGVGDQRVVGLAAGVVACGFEAPR